MRSRLRGRKHEQNTEQNARFAQSPICTIRETGR